MKTTVCLLLCSALFFGQTKSKINYSNETVVISNDNKLKIESYVSESRTISRSKNLYEYNIGISYGSFNEISEIKGSTVVLKTNKKHNLNAASIHTFDAENENIFKSDSKIKQLSFPNVEDNSLIEFSYKNWYKQPRLLAKFNFQNKLKTETSKFEIKCDSTVEIAYKIFGNLQDKITFNKTKAGRYILYTWEAKDIPEFEAEENMPSATHFVPHIIYYIKSYQSKGKKEIVLTEPKDLYQWYWSLIKDINQKDETDLKNKTLEIIKNKTSQYEKAKAIFEWVQQNLHYVAFENGMGGFVPREAADIYQKLYGDCKDMANLLNQMNHYANISSNLVWIGTREKPYNYNDMPTPQTANHMINKIKIDGKEYYLDATDKFCPFPFPSQMIQGKEGMVGISDTEFEIKTVPILSALDNSINLEFKLNLEKNNIIGKVEAKTHGLFKTNLLNQLASSTNKEKEIFKYYINATNTKIELTAIDLQKNQYQERPSEAIFDVKLENTVKHSNDKLLVKPVLITPLKDIDIDIQKRKFSIEKDFAFVYNMQYNYEIPVGYKVEFLPENFSIENNLASASITYKVNQNNIEIIQKIESKKIILENKDFDLWNNFTKNLSKQYNQSFILSK